MADALIGAALLIVASAFLAADVPQMAFGLTMLATLRWADWL